MLTSRHTLTVVMHHTPMTSPRHAPMTSCTHQINGFNEIVRLAVADDIVVVFASLVVVVVVVAVPFCRHRGGGGGGRRGGDDLVVEHLREVVDVVAGHAQRVELRQLRVCRHPRQRVLESPEGAAQHAHPRSLAVVGGVARHRLGDERHRRRRR